MLSFYIVVLFSFFFFFQAEDGIRDYKVTGVQTCALPISLHDGVRRSRTGRHAAGGDARGEPPHRAHGAAGRARLPREIARVRPPGPWAPSGGGSALPAPAWPARSSFRGSLPRGGASPRPAGGPPGP